jgi:hypothetical protein
VAKEYKTGDVVLADKNTTHWWQNKGTEQVVFLPVNIFKPRGSRMSLRCAADCLTMPSTRRVGSAFGPSKGHSAAPVDLVVDRLSEVVSRT